MRKICCFAGHSQIANTTDIYNALMLYIEKLINEKDVLEFWVGNYGVFDRMSAGAVRSLKEKYKNIELNLVIPYVTKEIGEYKEMYYKEYDNILITEMPENTPQRLMIIKCNEYMVNNSKYLIAYVSTDIGGAAKTLEYAKRKSLKIINIADKKTTASDAVVFEN